MASNSITRYESLKAFLSVGKATTKKQTNKKIQFLFQIMRNSDFSAFSMLLREKTDFLIIMAYACRNGNIISDDRYSLCLEQ